MKYLYSNYQFDETFSIADSIEEAIAEAKALEWDSVYVYTSKPAEFWGFDSASFFDEDRNFSSEDMNAPMEESWTSLWDLDDSAYKELNILIEKTIKTWAARHSVRNFYYADELVHSEVFEVSK